MRDTRTPASQRGAQQGDDEARQVDGSPVGFQRHPRGSARRTPARQPRATRGAQDAAEEPVETTDEPRTSATRPGGDYLGTGNPCRVCGRPVDPSQSRCPHCGAFQRPLYLNPAFIVACVVAVALVVLLSIGIHSCSTRAPQPGTDTPATSTPQSTEDKTAINDAIAAAQSTVDENAAAPTYTANSMMALQSALSAAQGVSDDPNATTEQIDEAIANLQSASNGLLLRPVAFGESYDWPWYDPLVETLTNDPSYVGSQIAMEGTLESVTAGTDGSVSIVASSGDVACPIQVTCTNLTDLSGVDSTLPQGERVEVAGTVTGLVEHDNGDGTTSMIPAITADFVRNYIPVE